MGNYSSAHFVLTYQMASISLKELQWHWREHLATLNVLFAENWGWERWHLGPGFQLSFSGCTPIFIKFCILTLH